MATDVPAAFAAASDDAAGGLASTASEVKDFALGDAGKRRIEWAFQSMPVLQTIRKLFIKSQPLAGIRVSASLHLTADAANLLIALRDGGAEPAACASGPLSTQDDVAASLVRDFGIPIFAVNGESHEAHEAHQLALLDHRPHVLVDDGGGLVALLHTRRPDLLDSLLGATEETARGAVRLQAMWKDGVLRVPIIAVNEAYTKHLFDNRYGTGQNVVDGIIRAANVLIAGMNVVVAGYGWCGRGIAIRARGLGAQVIVTEIDPLKAIEAAMDGCRVLSMQDAAQIGDIFCTVTGNRNVIAREHFERMKNGAILCNAGHANIEIDLETLARTASSRRAIGDCVQEYAMRDGRRLYVLGEGRLINMTAAEGHPSSVMDISLSNQALSVDYIVKNHLSLKKTIQRVPAAIDRTVAKLKLEAMGINIDRLSVEQEQYLASWSETA
jgi:adenosylhomocysteinase